MSDQPTEESGERDDVTGEPIDPEDEGGPDFPDEEAEEEFPTPEDDTGEIGEADLPEDDDEVNVDDIEEADDEDEEEGKL